MRFTFRHDGLEMPVRCLGVDILPTCGGLIAESCPTLATPWIVAYQAPLFMGFPRQEYWSGLPFPPPVSIYSWYLRP